MFEPWDLGHTIRVTAFTLTALSTFVVALRFYCRLWIVGKLKVYDHIMSTAVICTWGLCVINYYQTINGTGQKNPPNWKPPPPTPENMAIMKKLLRDSAISWFAYRITYVVSLGIIKMSILVFYLSFATSRTFRHLVIITMVVVALFTVVTGFLNGFECPHEPSMTLDERIFDPNLAAKCLKRPILYYCQAAFNILSDTWILFLPMPSLLQLRMASAKRWSVIAVFSVGLLVPIASAFRIWGLVVWATATTEPRYKGGYMLFWSQVEVNTAIICASMPSLQPLFKRVVGLLLSYRTHSAYYYYGEGPPTIQHNPGRITHATYTCSVEAPSSTYQATKREGEDTGNELVVIKETDEEEQIWDRDRHFASQSSLTDTHDRRTPERPKEILSYG